MSKLNGLKEKAMAVLGTIIDKSSDLYSTAEDKAKYLAATTKLKAEIAKDNTEVKKLYTDLGSLYYCLYNENPDEKLSQLCEEIKTILDRIAIKQREIEALSAQEADNDIVVDLTEDEAAEPEEAPAEEAPAEEAPAEEKAEDSAAE